MSTLLDNPEFARAYAALEGVSLNPRRHLAANARAHSRRRRRCGPCPRGAKRVQRRRAGSAPATSASPTTLASSTATRGPRPRSPASTPSASPRARRCAVSSSGTTATCPGGCPLNVANRLRIEPGDGSQAASICASCACFVSPTASTLRVAGGATRRPGGSSSKPRSAG